MISIVLVFGLAVNVSAINCTEADGGLNDIFNKSECNGTYAKEDTCGVGNVIDETGCRYDPVIGSEICVFIPAGTCPGECVNGACVEPMEEVSCEDTDGGKNYDVKGTTIDSVTNIYSNDSCNGSKLTEYYCSNNSRSSTKYYTCPDLCVDGVCVNVTEENETCETDQDCYNETVCYQNECVDAVCNDICNPSEYPKCQDDAAWECIEGEKGCFIESLKMFCEVGCENGQCNEPGTCVTNQHCGCYEVCEGGACLLWAGPLINECDHTDNISENDCLGGFDCMNNECIKSPECTWAPGTGENNTTMYLIVAAVVIIGGLGYWFYTKKK